MARKKKKRSPRKPTLPIAVVGGLLAPFTLKTPGGRTIIGDIVNQDWEWLPKDLRETFVGIDSDGKFRPEWIVRNYLPMFVGVFLHKAASKLGINRMIAQSGIPYIRI